MRREGRLWVGQFRGASWPLGEHSRKPDPPGEASGSAEQFEDPAWWPTYCRLIRSCGNEATPVSWDESTSDDHPAEVAHFAELFRPIATAECERWVTGVQAAPSAQPPPTFELLRDVANSLVRRLSEVATPVLSEVMWRDVAFGERFLAHTGIEQGSAKRERYREFCQRQRADGLTEVLTEFPALGRLLAGVIDQWHRTSTLLLERVAADRDMLAERLGVPRSQSLTGVTTSAGDRHNDGDSVSLLRFGATTVVYKPRSVQLEALYADAAAALSARQDAPP